MADVKLNQYGLEWTPGVFELDNDGEKITVLTPPDMTQETWDSHEGYVVLPVSGKGVTHVALPNRIALDEGFISVNEKGEAVAGPELDSLWSFFMFQGDRLDLLYEGVLPVPEMKGSYDFREFDRKVRENGKSPLRIGDRCLADYERHLGNLSPLDAVTAPYERFLDSIDEIVAEMGNVYLQEARLLMTLSNPRLVMADPETETERPHGAPGVGKDSCFHELFCSLSVKRTDGDGKVTGELFRDMQIKIASIPAMNMKTGLFLFRGDEYAMAMMADPFCDAPRIETAGMAFRDMLEKGIVEMGKRILTGIDMTGSSVSEIRNFINEKKSDPKFMADSEFSAMYSGEGAYARRWRRLGEGEAGIVGRMRAPMTVLTPALYSYDKNGELVPDEINDIKPKFSGIIDNLTSPSGKNITESACLGMGVRMDDKGIPYLPCYEIKDGKVNRDAFKWIPVHSVFSLSLKGEVTEGMTTMDDFIVAHPDDVREDGNSFFTSPDGNILVRDHGVLRSMKPEEAQIVMIDRNCSRAPGANSNTDRSNLMDTRANIREGNVKGMTSMLPGSDGATIGPQYSHCDELAVNAVVRAEFDGTVTSIVKDEPFAGIDRWVSMTVSSDDGRKQVIDLSERRYGGDGNVYRSCPTDGIREGVSVKKGQVLTDSPGIVHGEAVIGTPALTAWVPMGAKTTDDCIMISASYAKKMTAERRITKSREFPTGVAISPYGPTMIFNPLIGRDPAEGTTVFGVDCSRLGENGIIRDGETVQPGDVIAFMIVPDGTKKLTVGEQRMLEYPTADRPFGPLPDGYGVLPLRYEGKAPGMIRTRKNNAVREGFEKIEWDVVSREEFGDGDKLSIDGVKGVVQVVKDDEMPRIAEGPLSGYIPDILLNATSYIKRLAPGTMTRGMANLLGLYEERRVDIPNGTRNIAEELQTEMKRLGVPEDGRLRIVGKTPDVNFGTDGSMRVQLGVINAYDAGHRASQALILEGKYISPMKEMAALSQNASDLFESSYTDRMKASALLFGSAGLALKRTSGPIVLKKDSSASGESGTTENVLKKITNVSKGSVRQVL